MFGQCGQRGPRCLRQRSALLAVGTARGHSADPTRCATAVSTQSQRRTLRDSLPFRARGVARVRRLPTSNGSVSEPLTHGADAGGPTMTRRVLAGESPPGPCGLISGASPFVRAIGALGLVLGFTLVSMPAGSVTVRTVPQTWRTQIAPPAAQHLVGDSCPAPRDCFAVGWSVSPTPGAVIIATTDGGSQWAVQTVPSGIAQLSAISCASKLDCIAVGDGAAIPISPRPLLPPPMGASCGHPKWLPRGPTRSVPSPVRAVPIARRSETPDHREESA